MAVSSNPTVSMREFFAPGGILAEAHPHYEFRVSQLEMAQGLETAFRERRHLLVEAGTGTGKTLAYLVPALLSGKKVVVSTGTKNLQEQLYLKDVPFVLEALAKRGLGDFRVAYLKGRANYLCREKLYEITRLGSRALFEDLEPAHLRALAAWEPTTATGDRAELTALPETPAFNRLWESVDARRERCTGERCPQFDRCFVTEARRRALEADLVIVNHHLLFADLALKRTGVPGMTILPNYQAAIFDEAHEVEDVAGQFFGVAAGNARVEDLARDCQRLFMQDSGSPDLYAATQRVARSAESFFASLPSAPGREGFEGREAFLEEQPQPYLTLVGALDSLHSALAALPEEGPSGAPEVAALRERTLRLVEDLRFLMEGRDDRFVHWIERRGRYTFLQATPIDVSTLLEENLYDELETVVMTSATLAVSGSLEYARRRLGLRHARERVHESHYDFERQALLYLPQPETLPDPRHHNFVGLAAAEVTRLLNASRGRAFVLFTSYAQMEQVYERVSGKIQFSLLIQGMAPRTALLDRFRKKPGAVLFATASFWQGVDVPGEQLSCVIVDRLPFAVPTDPVVAARSRRIEEDGGSAFTDYHLPGAVLALKQGFGRLIRGRSDRGVLALLDTRIRTKPYGSVFLESLPPYRVTADIGEVERFFQGADGLRGKKG